MPPTKPLVSWFLISAIFAPTVAAVTARAGQVFCHLIHINVPMVNLDKKLHGALERRMQATHARCLYNCAVVQIPQLHVFLPAHQKSSAEGMRV